MKNIFKYIAVIAFSLVAIIACDKPNNNEPPIEEEPAKELLFAESTDSLVVEAGAQVSVALLNVDSVSNFEIVAPLGWSAEIVGSDLVVNSPAADAQEYDITGRIIISYLNSHLLPNTLSVAVRVYFPELPPVEEITFELVYSDVTATSAVLEVYPSSDDIRYYYDVCTLDDFNSLDGNVGAIVQEYIDYLSMHYPDFTMEDILGAMLSQGYDTDVVTGLPSNTTMCFYAIAIDEEGLPASEAEVMEFTTLEGGDPADCTFDMEVSEIRGTSVFISIVPSDNSVRYWYAVTSRDGYPGDIPMMVQVKEEAANYAAEMGMTLEQVIAGVTVAGPVAEYWWDLEIDTEYYLYAFAMDEQGNYLGDMYKEPFTTAMEDISDAELSVDYRYFDGDELYEYDPVTYATAQGKVVVQVKATPNEFADIWAVALAAGDFTDETLFPYDATINAMLSSGSSQYNKSISQFYANWSDCTILAFAADYYGFNGPLTRILVQPTKDGAADVSELAPVGVPAQSSLLMLQDQPVAKSVSIGERIKDVKIGRNL